MYTNLSNSLVSEESSKFGLIMSNGKIFMSIDIINTFNNIGEKSRRFVFRVSCVYQLVAFGIQL